MKSCEIRVRRPGRALANNVEYDAYGRTTRTTDTFGNYVVVEYDLMGQQTRQVKYDSGNTALSEERTQYDGLGRVTRTRTLASPGGNVSDTADAVSDTVYDAGGRVLTEITCLTDAVAATKTFVYDNAGRVLTQTGSDEPTTAFVYDLAGHALTQTVNPGGLALTTLSAYDEMGRQTRVTQPDGTYTVNLYDVFGQGTKAITYASGGTAVAASLNLYHYSLGQVTKTYQYHDPANNITAVTADDPANEYVYTVGGRLTKTIDPNGNATTYNFDARGRQITVTDGATNKQISLYDNADQVITKLRLDYDEVASAQITFTTAYEADSLGRVTRTIEQGPDGDIAATTDNLITAVGYDALGRVTQAQDPKGQKTAHTYDALGRQTRLTEAKDDLDRYTDFAYNQMIPGTGYLFSSVRDCMG